ncbi:hypothetical protein [Mycolicibacterium brumae]|uniref:Uncharacterized protein n=1 Tax=Mycolicibacterium brumae TaxID=85968 RepID=A0A2G5PAL4_9MYCO|nr:hypothetical protein [Mycolicibacterium brumae]MCV7193725.1 hypothetical protein [Mycolicibacterium brumae]PIB75110.1 hypothetical protein CQY22_010950 [Mycolicibacterium brumae]RWA17426.1 hypothetical protein MBRU_07290 [Mycolicibacterium brumae DSM 44177]UWW09004.1 hypothetical protein L2Z93_002084 [Mycolicibacterium brumae]
MIDYPKFPQVRVVKPTERSVVRSMLAAAVLVWLTVSVWALIAHAADYAPVGLKQWAGLVLSALFIGGPLYTFIYAVYTVPVAIALGLLGSRLQFGTSTGAPRTK